MISLDDFKAMIADENGEPYGQAYAFTVGSEFVGMFIVNLNTIETGEVLAIVVSTDDPQEVIFDEVVPDFETGVQLTLGYLAEHPGDVINMSEGLL